MEGQGAGRGYSLAPVDAEQQMPNFLPHTKGTSAQPSTPVSYDTSGDMPADRYPPDGGASRDLGVIVMRTIEPRTRLKFVNHVVSAKCTVEHLGGRMPMIGLLPVSAGAEHCQVVINRNTQEVRVLWQWCGGCCEN